MTVIPHCRTRFSNPARLAEADWALRYGSIRGKPKCGNTLLSANHVIAEM